MAEAQFGTVKALPPVLEEPISVCESSQVQMLANEQCNEHTSLKSAWHSVGRAWHWPFIWGTKRQYFDWPFIRGTKRQYFERSRGGVEEEARGTNEAQEVGALDDGHKRLFALVKQRK